MSDLVGAGEYSRRKAIAFAVCALFVITAFAGLSMNSGASTLTVKVIITHIHGIDWVDTSPNYPDFYWKVWLGGSSVPTADPYCTDLNDIYPNWPAYFFNLPAGAGQSYTLMIELWDDDGAGTASDDICDISKQVGGGDEANPRSSQAVMTYYIDTSSWIGDDSSSGDTNGAGHVSGEEDAQAGDYDDCELWFTAVTIPNNTPIATIDSVTPNPANVGTTVYFSGHGTDYDGSIVAYNWRTGTTTLSTAPSFSKSNFAVGPYRIYFKVQDDDGGWSSETYVDLNVVNNAAPTATISSITPSTTVSWGTAVTFSGYGTDSDGTITGYNWRTGTITLSTAPSFSKSNFAVGSYIIYFKVMDDDGVWSNEVPGTLIVNAVAMEVKVTVTHVKQIDKVDSGNNQADFYVIATYAGTQRKSAEPIVLDANDIYPNWVATWSVTAGTGSSGSLVIALWDDDGATGDDPCDIAKATGIDNADMTYYVDTNSWTGDDASAGDANGPGYVSGNEDGSTAIDQDDCELWFTIVRTAPNSAPTAVIDSISPNPAMQGTTVNFNGHGTDTDGTVVAWNWRSSINGQLSSAASFSSFSLSAGSHTIYYKVCDDDGVWSGEATRNLTINAAPDSDGDGIIDSLDIDPLVNLEVTVHIVEITQLGAVDSSGEGDFFWTVKVGSQTIASPNPWQVDVGHITPNADYVFPVADNQRYVEIVIELWDNDDNKPSRADICDISRDLGGGDERNPDSSNVEITYDLQTGSWSGDDYFGDPSGYGYVSGYDDGSLNYDGDILTLEDDCALWFYVTQNDFDSDGLTWWDETYTYAQYGANPRVADSDADGLPTWWEKLWDPTSAYMNPLLTNTNGDFWDDNWEDFDEDSKYNSQEYEWGTNPLVFEIILEVSFEWDASGTYLDNFADGMKRTSAILYDVTDGGLYIRKLIYHELAVGWNEADIIVYQGADDYPNSWPNAHINGYMGGGRVALWERHSIYDSILGKLYDVGPDDASYSRVTAHELGHYVLCCYDEYKGPGGDAECNGCIMDVDAWDELCTPANHDPDGDTEQEEHRGESCWETYFSTYLDIIWIDLNLDGIRDTMVDSNGNGVPDVLDWYVPWYMGPATSIRGPWMLVDYSDVSR